MTQASGPQRGRLPPIEEDEFDVWDRDAQSARRARRNATRIFWSLFVVTVAVIIVAAALLSTRI